MRLWMIGILLAASLQATWAQEGQGVEIGGVTYEYVDPGEPFREAPRPAQDWRPPEPSEAEQAAGMMAYVTSDPGDYRPYRRPKPQERVDRLTAFLTPGEDEPVWVGVWPLADLEGLTATVALPDAPLTVDVRYLHCWPQRTGWRSREWYLTPELILPCADGKRQVPARRGVLQERPFDVKRGETTAFWLTLTAREDAPPGTYQGAVTLSSAERPALVLPLRVEVLPFRLQKPEDRHWMLYCDAFRWNWGSMSDDQVLAELRDFARHGITGLVEISVAKVDVSRLPQKEVEVDVSPYQRLTRLCEAAGLPGPHVWSFGIAFQVKEVLGIDCDLWRDPWPQAITEGVATVARKVVEATAGMPRWYYYGYDEPSGDNTYAIQDYKAWHQGGAATYATFGDPRFLEQAAAFLTAPCFVTYLISSEEGARAARESCQRTGAEFWWYGTGSYVNPFPQEAFLFHNRYGAGYLFWKSGATASVAWTFCRPHEDVFNDFDGSQANSAEPKEQATAYPHLLRPDDWSTYQGAIPTIAWEALREGTDDYRYLYTLTQLIGQAMQSRDAAVRQAGQQAQATLDALMDAMPWTNPMLPATFETERMQQVRREVANLIVDLQDALAGKPRVGARSSQARVSFIVQTVAPRTHRWLPLPGMTVARTEQPPRIDGALDDPCWATSDVAGQFKQISDGTPAPVATQVRVLQDDRALYVAFDCAEPSMDKLVAKQQGHDAPMVWTDDGVELFVAGADRDPYAHVIINTNCSVYDEIGQDTKWDPEMEVAVTKGPDRWSMELALPWAELERGGVRRSPVMAMNFCRNRFTDRQAHPHSAWSCTYDGYHVPQRFGLAQLEPGPVVLGSVQTSVLWGRQELTVELRNTTAQPLVATVGVPGASPRRLPLAPRAATVARVPLEFHTPGARAIALEWSAQGWPAQRAKVPVAVPEPVAVESWPPFISDGDVVRIPVTVGISPTDPRPFRLRLSVVSARGKQRAELPARPGRSRRIKATVHGSAWVQLELVAEGSNRVGMPIRRRMLVLSSVG